MPWIMRRELRDSPQAGERVRNSPNVDSQVRTIVLSSTRPPKGSTVESTLRSVQLQEDIAAGFPGSRHIRVENAGHYIQRDRPDVVVNAARELAGCGELAPSLIPAKATEPARN